MSSHFKTYGYEIVRNAISNEMAELLAINFKMIKELEWHTKGLSDDFILGDKLVAKCYRQYGPLCFESLMLLLKPKIEAIVGKNLLPTYSYGRIYYPDAVMPKHTDRGECQYSVTLTIDCFGEEPWPIWFKDLNDNDIPVSLNVGDMCVYNGIKLYHWRQPFAGKQQIQTFMHYVDADSPFAVLKYDGRAMLGLPPEQYT